MNTTWAQEQWEVWMDEFLASGSTEEFSVELKRSEYYNYNEVLKQYFHNAKSWRTLLYGRSFLENPWSVGNMWIVGDDNWHFL